MIALPKRCQAHYSGLQCAFVLGHDHPHGNEDSGVYVTWGRMVSPQQPVVGCRGCTCPWAVTPDDAPPYRDSYEWTVTDG